MLVIDHAVRVNDVHEEFGGRVRTNALQVRTKLIADLTNHVTGLAGSDKEFLALSDIARLFDFRTKLRDNFVLGAIGAGVELQEQRGGALGDRFIRVTGQLGGLQRTDLHRRERLGFEGIEHEARPFRTGHQRSVGRLTNRGFGFQERAEQGLARRGVTGGSQGFDRSERDEVRRTLLEKLSDGRQNGCIDAADSHQRSGRGGAGFRGGLFVSDEWQQLLRGRGKLGLEFVTLRPSGGERDSGEAKFGVAVGDGLLQRGHGGGLIGGSGSITGREDLQGRASDGYIAGGGGGLQHAETGDAIIRGSHAGR